MAEKIIRNTCWSGVQSGRLIYVARTDTKVPPIVNEDALIERLKILGFEILVASKTPVAKQIEAFHGAKLIIGGHGAGLTNIMFSRPGTYLLELIQSTYLNNRMMRLAQAAGIYYFTEMFFLLIMRQREKAGLIILITAGLLILIVLSVRLKILSDNRCKVRGVIVEQIYLEALRNGTYP